MTKAEQQQMREAAVILFQNATGIDNDNLNKLYIDRRFWSRGAGENNQLMGRQVNGGVGLCCLGFMCLQRGLAPVNIFDTGTPADVRKDAKGKSLDNVPEHLEHFVRKNESGYTNDTKLTDALVNVNDAVIGTRIGMLAFRLLKSNRKDRMLRSEKDREQLIARLFKLADIEVVFVN